ncbi:IQ domain-containing protein M, partial [Pygoscelis antarcticus]
QKCNGSVSSQQLSIPYCGWGSAQTPLSAPSILENNANSYNTKAFGKASWKTVFQQGSWLEKRSYKLPERPLSKINSIPAETRTVTFSPTYPEKAVKSCKAYIYLSPQHAMEQEERISITELLSGIDSVSRALENEKKENFSSLKNTPIFPTGKVYQDWRGMIVPNPVKEYSQARQKNMKGKEVSFVHQTEKQISCTLISSDKHLDLQNQKKVKKNVTHMEVFEGSHDSRKHPSSREVLKAVFCIQRCVRWWLEHRAFKRVKIKSTSHGPSLPAVVRYYCKMIARIKYRAGVLDSSTPLRYFELEEWMDKERYVIQFFDRIIFYFNFIYETMFSKSEFDKKMDRNYLPEFLRGCVCSIPASGIQRVFQLVCPASTAAVRSIKKHQAIEMAFTLFSPLGAKVKNLITVPLPWVHPLMDGK